MFMSRVISFLALAISFGQANTVTVYWDITWVTAAPDGFARPVIGINGAWPCPILEATVGDTVIVHLTNKLGNETTGLHFHGIRQAGTPEMDGAVAATQCPVAPGSSLTYKFLADRPGTYWYHSHAMGQYPDGLRGPLIIHDPEDPYKGQVDQEVILTVSDWYHSQTIPLMQTMLSPSNTLNIPPLPDSIIVNEGGTGKINFEKGKTYRLRIVSFSAFSSAMFHFNSHTMQVIAQDGSYIQKTEAYQIRISPAQRYDVLISAIDRDNKNFPFLFSLDQNADYTNPAANPPFLGGLSWPHNFTGYLVMDSSVPTTSLDVVDLWQPVDDSHFTNPTGAGPYGPVTKTIVLDFDFCTDNYSIPRSCFNDKTYVPQKVPTLYSAATTGDDNTNPVVYGGVIPYVVKKGEIVDIVVNNLDTAIHPFHLHGHHFQVLDRPRTGTGKWPGYMAQSYPAYPATKDTLHVMGNSHAIMRFKADNPGVWLFHCHIEWHVEMGLTATIVEGPEQLRGRRFPDDHIQACKAAGTPYKGNAAGNKVNYTDTTGMSFVNDPVYIGALWNPPTTAARSRLIWRRKGKA